MKIAYARRVIGWLADAPPALRRAVSKQLRFPSNNLHHPSLHAKEYDETRNIWQARVNRDWRFYFTLEGDTARILNVMTHPKRGALR